MHESLEREEGGRRWKTREMSWERLSPNFGGFEDEEMDYKKSR
jgi:hypothetical protein